MSKGLGVFSKGSMAKLDIKKELRKTIKHEGVLIARQEARDINRGTIDSPFKNEDKSVADTVSAMLAAIKKEVTKDPTQKGYAGKTNAEIADLLNASYTEALPGDSIPVPRVSAIFASITFAPNVVDEALVAEALE